MDAMPRFAARLAPGAVAIVLSGCGSRGGAVDSGRAVTPDASAACDEAAGDCAGSSDAGVAVRPGVTVLATRQARPGVLAVDADNVYWMNWDLTQPAPASRLMKCKKTGCNDAPTVLAEGPWTNAANLVVHGQDIYWGGTGGVLKCSTNGCNGGPTVVVSGMGPIGDVAVDPAGRVYYVVGANASANGQAAAPIVASALGCAVACDDGGNPSVPVQIDDSSAVAVDDTGFYITGSAIGEATLVTCPFSRCAQSSQMLVFDNPVVLSSAIAVNSTEVYFVGLHSSTSNGGDLVEAVPKQSIGSGGSSLNVPPFINGLSGPTAIAVDEVTLYAAQWGGGADGGDVPADTGGIVMCPVSGCGGLAPIFLDYLNYPSGIAVDDENVYWTETHASGDRSVNDDGRVAFRAK